MLQTCYLQVALLTFSGLGAAQQADSIQEQEDQSLEQRLREAAPEDRLPVLRRALDGVRYRSLDPDRYGIVLNSALAAFELGPITDRREALRVEQGYLLAALGEPDRLSALTEIYLVLRLRGNVPPVLPDRDETLTKLTLLFHAWRRLERETIADYNFADEPLLDVAPPLRPSGQLLVSGVPPASIRDPVVRGEYEAEIAANRLKAAEYRRQNAFRSVKDPFIRHVEWFLISAIRSGAVTVGEVNSNLSLVRDDKARERVLATIRARSSK